jgi:PKD repeat protein
VRVTASPGSVSQDGGSQSQVQVTALGPDGRPVVGLPLRLDMFVGGVGQDYGTLSARTVVTNSSGVAMVVYTAPPSPVAGIFGTCLGLPGNCVQVGATPTGQGSVDGRPFPPTPPSVETISPELVTIRLVPPGVILPPAGAPTAAFTFSPQTAAANSPVTFDASTSQVGSGASQIVSYTWAFGDGTSGTGKTATHTYTAQGSYNVTLTVTNDRTLSNSIQQSVSVATAAGPTAAFVFGPTPVVANIDAFFDASASVAGSGHRIVSYSWNFGDGDPISTRTTPIENHDFNAAGVYTVVLVITDEAGQKGTTSQTLTVTAPTAGSAGAPVANFTSSPTAPVVAELVVFDSSSSTVASGRTITDYAWNFGDDTPIVHGDNRIISHNFARANTFVVNLVITDSSGATGQKSATVVVFTGDPVPVITASPSTATAGTLIGFSSAGSKTFGGATITSYSWNFGDPASGGANSSALANPTHTFAAAGTYTVRLTITDSQGRSSTVTATVTIT